LTRPFDLLTDTPGDVSAFFGSSPSAIGTVRAENRSAHWDSFGVARAFCGQRRRIRALRVAGFDPPSRFPYLVVQGRASRSNLEVMTGLDRQGIALPDGLVCIALQGERFMGRYDRSWNCRAGNLHAVIHLKPRLAPEAAGAAFSVLAAVACVDAVVQIVTGSVAEADRTAGAVPTESPAPRVDTTALRPRIQWINDVWIGDHKIAGVLTRQSFMAPYITDVYLGIGVNVLVNPEITSLPFVPKSWCLAEAYPHITWSPGTFLGTFLEKLDRWYSRLLREGWTCLLRFYRESSNVLGRNVRIFEDGYGFGESGRGTRRLLGRGVVEAVEDNLALKLRGTTEPFGTGRLAFDEDCRDKDRG